MELWLWVGGERSLWASLTLFALTWLISLLPPVILRGRFRVPAGGLALPGLIFLSDEVLNSGEAHLTSVMRHEMVHIQQMRRYSPFVTALMLAYHYAPWLRRPTQAHMMELYHKNPLEIKAHAKMSIPTPLMKHVNLTQGSARPVFAVGALWLTMLWLASLGLSFLVV
jgi:hypothetical protein